MGWIRDFQQIRLERKIWRELIRMSMEQLSESEKCIECDQIKCAVCACSYDKDCD